MIDRTRVRRYRMSVLVHQLRNTLTPVSGYGRLLQGKIEDKRLREWAEQIAASADQMQVLLTSLHELTHAKAVERRPIRVNEILWQAAEGRRADVREDVADSTINADPEAVLEALDELMTNAADAAPDAPAILAAARQGAHVRLDVLDQGPGIPADVRDRIFDVCVSTKGRPGLGLAVCRKVAELHGGSAEAAALPEGGSRFSLLLPA